VYRPSTTRRFNARTGCHRRMRTARQITQVWLGPNNNIDFVFGMATLHLKLCGIVYIYILNLRSRVCISVAIKINTIPQNLRNRSPPEYTTLIRRYTAYTLHYSTVYFYQVWNFLYIYLIYLLVYL
jgi:hypothetical protein